MLKNSGWARAGTSAATLSSMRDITTKHSYIFNSSGLLCKGTFLNITNKHSFMQDTKCCNMKIIVILLRHFRRCLVVSLTLDICYVHAWLFCQHMTAQKMLVGQHSAPSCLAFQANEPRKPRLVNTCQHCIKTCELYNCQRIGRSQYNVCNLVSFLMRVKPKKLFKSFTVTCERTKTTY